MTVNSLKNNFASADYPYKIFFSLDCPFKNIFASNDYPFKPLFSSLDFPFKNLFFLQTIRLKTSFLLKTISLKILFSLAVYPCKNTFFGRLYLEKTYSFRQTILLNLWLATIVQSTFKMATLNRFCTKKGSPFFSLQNIKRYI